jgi:hypothetical protein
MSPIENHVDWTAPSTPVGERVAPSLSRPMQPAPAQPKRTVMETLLGDDKLTAYDASGNDPYNTTGRFVRR